MTLRSRRPVLLLRALSVALGAVLLALAVEAGAHPGAVPEAIRSAVAGPSTAAAPPPVTWCGRDVATADRAPDVFGGNQIHVLYAVPSDGPDQFPAFVSRIATDVSAIDAWWRREDPARTIRFDLAAFPNCPTAAGQLDITSVRLPHPATTFLTLGSNLGAVATDLAALGFDTRTKRYLVYYDGPTNDTDVCGTAFRDPTGTGGPQFVAAIWTRSCGADVGAGDVMAAAAAHELLHSLGVLPRGAPHPCSGDEGHPCDSPIDLMYPELSEHFDNLRLDVGRDDYYGHAGTWLDAQDSRWLMRADVAPSSLTVAVQGRSPQDRVTSDPVGIACPGTCAVFFDTGSQVRLVAVAGSGSRFLGWTGACTGAATECTVPMDAAKTVEARFGPTTFRLSLVVNGSGRMGVPALGVSCTRRCSAAVEAGAVVRVRATPARGWRFVSWAGACRGRGACTVRMSRASSVGVVFRRLATTRG